MMAPLLQLIVVAAIAGEGVLGREAAPPPARATGRIVGGWEVYIGQFPYQLSLEYDGYHICGASAVAPRLALTAGHCCIGTNETDLTVRGGSSTLEEGGIVFPVKKLVIHPDYDDSNLDFDVCVLRIGGTFQNKPNIGIIQPTSSGTIPSGELAIVTGWGATESNGNFVPNLRSLAVKVWSTKNCTDQAANYMTSSGSMMCAGSVGRSFCVGDSGGPLVYDQRQIGIVSFLINECGGTAPAIYTRLSHRSVRDFIRQQINNDQRRMAQAATG
ncbi:trypsin 3A1 [Anopheles gambiae]|uniref:trypsin 3A1 n=1 Tax=Anopheles gambiae TaxID=7165 RepID=UPI002AC9D327|nr:trypsin 3A1 [Anopheles gambiae]